jgi:hypothetical protein
MSQATIRQRVTADRADALRRAFLHAGNVCLGAYLRLSEAGANPAGKPGRQTGGS